MNSTIGQIYGEKVRIRVCGMCWHDGQLLLVNHKMGPENVFWSPPGGGVEFGESLHETLKREFLEETGIVVSIDRFLFGCEFISPPLHAVELFFETVYESGDVRRGQDPEVPIIAEVRYMSPAQIRKLPPAHLHGIFQKAVSPFEFEKLGGFYRI